LTLDILCYQQMKIGILRSHQRPALESLLGKSHVHAKVKGDAVHRSDDEDARRWFADPSSRPATMKAIEDAGYPLDAVEVEAFQRALPSLATIERLIVSAQKRLDVSLNQLEKTAKARAEAMRIAIEAEIAAHDAEALAWSKKSKAHGIATTDRSK